MRKLQENPRIKELATNPLLLTLLCLGFEEEKYLNFTLSDVYREGIDVLLKKWDAKFGIERREIYKNLKLERKKELLSQLAYNTFLPGNYFFKQELAEAEVRDYIVNLPESPNNPRQLDLDSEEVLKAIVAQHGLLIKRASDIYSFSHLSFHEYFTARYIVSSLKLENALTELTEHLYENRWREVFVLTTEMLKEADFLLIIVKRKVDNLIAEDKQIQAFLSWAKTKSMSVDTPFKQSAIRAHYLTCAFSNNLNLASAIDPALLNDLNNIRTIIGTLGNHTLKYSHALALDILLSRAYNLAYILSRSSLCDLDLVCFLHPNFTRTIDLALAHIFDQHKLKEAVQELKDGLLHIWNNPKEAVSLWKSNGKIWADQIKNITINHRNIGHVWQFKDAQKKLLDQCLRVNRLLVDCLNSECYVTRSVREEIENTLLLPAADLDK